MPDADRKRFMSKCEPEPNTGCWLWTGATFTKGYGALQLSNPRRTVRVHRFAYEQFVGPIPEGMYVLHHCDTPACVNPAHLFLGTHADNMKDMVQKGRSADTSGENAGNARLTEDKVRAIRLRHQQGERQTHLAKEYGVSISTVNLAVNHKTWNGCA